MRLVCCADFHSSFDLTRFGAKVKGFAPDVIETLGDISVQDLRVIKKAADTLGIPVIGICGNHDEVDALVKAGIEDLHGKAKTIKGVSFAGMGGSLRYKPSDNMFLSQRESIEVAAALPKADVLITHDKAYIGMFADTKAQYAKDPHAGLVGISKYIRKNKPKYHLYGHLHTRMTEEKHGTTSMCVYGIQLVDIGGKDDDSLCFYKGDVQVCPQRPQGRSGLAVRSEGGE